MRAQAMFFWGALASFGLAALLLTAGWLWNDHVATTGETLLRQGHLDSYDYEWGGMDDRGVVHGPTPESRSLSKDYLFLLKIVPASIFAVWFVASWIVWGPHAFRGRTLKSHFSALKKK